MQETTSRRLFLALAGSAAVAPFLARADDNFKIPPLLDHFILGCNELDRAIDFVERRTGVRAAFGGVHPGRGTRNALLSLGERRYLEIMAPDPAQNVVEQIAKLRELKEPRIVGWAAHRDDLEQFAARLREARVGFEGPQAGSRQRPDDKVLHWKTLTLKNDYGGLLPFFIEWDAYSIHPSVDAPKGCTLRRFEASTPNPDDLKRIVSAGQIDLSISPGEKAALHATIVGPKGEFSATS